MTRIKFLKLLQSLFLLFTILAASHAARAQMDEWGYIEPPSAAFEARFPKDYKLKEQKLRIDDNTVLFMSDYVANVKEGGKDKTYMLKFEQKMGGNLTGNMIAFALTSDSARYKKMVENLGGKILTDEDITHKGFRGKDIYATYKKDNMNMGLRVRILFTDSARIYLVTNGPAETSYSFRAKNFFENIDLFDGKAEIPGKFSDEWRTLTSKKNIFSIASPEKGNPYVESEAIFEEEIKPTILPQIKSIENAQMVFVDPILKYKLIYSLKSYRTAKEPSRSEIKMLMLEDNISKYVPEPSPDSFPVEQSELEGLEIVSARASVPTSTNYPNVNFVVLEAHYKDNFLVIQELAGPNNYVLSPLGLSLLATFRFHPEDYMKAPAAPIEDKAPAPTPEVEAPEENKSPDPAAKPEVKAPEEKTKPVETPKP